MTMTAFASVYSMTATGTSPPASEPAPRRRRRAPRRPRPASGPTASTLAQKYRKSANAPEESVLIGGDSVGAEEHQRYTQSSRFPATWSEVVRQLTVAVSLSYREGFERLRVDLRSPELVVRGAAPTGDRLPLLMEALNASLSTLLLNRANQYSSSDAPHGAVLYFNSAADLAQGARLISPSLSDSVDLHVLGDGHEAVASARSIAVLVCPTNTDGNPAHIEHVEMVHYSNWTHQNLVVMINPSLIALTRHGSLDDEPRPPSFLADYHPSYYIDPVAYMCKNATGAMLRCFPRKWEMYILRAHADGGFRLIAEQNSRPSREKLKCEFSWRADLTSEQSIG